MRKQGKRHVLLSAIAVAASVLVAMIFVLLLWEGDTAPAEILITEPLTLDENVKSISPELDALFESFQGNWIFDRSRGAVIYIGRYAESGWNLHPEYFGDESPEWILSVTGGEMLTDCQVVSWTTDSILFCRDGYYSMLRHTEAGGIEYAYGNTPDMLDGAIRTDDRTIAD